MARTTLQDFITRAKKVHGTQYDYSQVNYTGVMKKVTIICKSHGSFELRPKAHYDDHRGCPDCDTSGKSGFSFNSKWRKEPKNLYIISVRGENEKFLKFGVTVGSVKSRLSLGQFPYPYYEILLEQKFIDGERANNIEAGLKRRFKNSTHLCKIKFRGHTECINYDLKDELIAEVRKYPVI